MLPIMRWPPFRGGTWHCSPPPLNLSLIVILVYLRLFMRFLVHIFIKKCTINSTTEQYVILYRSPLGRLTKTASTGQTKLYMYDVRVYVAVTCCCPRATKIVYAVYYPTCNRVVSFLLYTHAIDA